MTARPNILTMIASISVLAIIVVSCKDKIQSTDEDLSKVPMQTLDGMFAVQTKNGNVIMRMEADVMQHFETDTVSTDFFPEGLSVYSYLEDGRIESFILADQARHTTRKTGTKEETWAAFGNVVIHNVIKQQTMETDTIYWDQGTKEIYTDCYVKMYSPDGLMQGYGMRSDDKARNSILMNPFNSYGVTEKDTTKVAIDSVNFIGPLLLAGIKNSVN